MSKFDMKQFVRERDEALRSLDKEKIIAYCKKYNMNIPQDEKLLFAGVHKARLGIKNITLEEQMESAIWLLENGFRLPEYTSQRVWNELFRRADDERTKTD